MAQARLDRPEQLEVSSSWFGQQAGIADGAEEGSLGQR